MKGGCYNVALLFAEAVAESGDRPALALDGNRQVTYRDLDGFSNRIVRFLLSQGVRKGDRIALSMEKCATAYALIVAALKAGFIYVALDPRNPPARRDAILSQCSPKLIFSDSAEDSPSPYPTVLCDDDPDCPEFCKAFSVEPAGTVLDLAGTDPAYIMFTSGSTGVPKGAVMSHDNLLHFIGWARSEYRFTPDDVHTHLNPLYFDNSVFDIYSTLFSGGTLVPFDYGTLQDPLKLANRLRDTRCTVWFSVPSLLMFLQVVKVATRANLGGLRKIIFGGEGFPKARLKPLFDELHPVGELYNVYGPTECTCICSSYRISAQDFEDLDGFPALGNVAGHFTKHILQGDVPVNPGDIGELCLGGSGVGLGYFNRPDITASAFVQNPLNASRREVIYRTGDLVREDPVSGKMHFIGRRDYQVKHMGYRIELEEIQHAIMGIQGVDETVVLHRRSGELSELVAVIATKKALAANEIRKDLSERLPKYMIPGKIHFVDKMPKNANGKTDRAALTRQFAGVTQ